MKTLNWTAKSYEQDLNDFGVPEEEKESNGGRIPDRCTKYGSWIRRNDPIAFNVGLQEKQREWSHLMSRY
jgi:hypothetical protein